MVATSTTSAETRAKVCPRCGNYYLKALNGGGLGCPSIFDCNFKEGDPIQKPAAAMPPVGLSPEFVEAEKKKAMEAARLDERKQHEKTIADLVAQRDQARRDVNTVVQQRDEYNNKLSTVNTEAINLRNALNAQVQNTQLQASNVVNERNRADENAGQVAALRQQLNDANGLLEQTKQKLAQMNANYLLVNDDKAAWERSQKSVVAAREADAKQYLEAREAYDEQIANLESQMVGLRNSLAEEMAKNNPPEHQDGASSGGKEGKKMSENKDKEAGMSAGEKLASFGSVLKDNVLEGSKTGLSVGFVEGLIGVTRKAMKDRGLWSKNLDTELGKSITKIAVPAAFLGLATAFPQMPKSDFIKAQIGRALQGTSKDAVQKALAWVLPTEILGFFNDHEALEAGALEEGAEPFNEDVVSINERQPVANGNS